MEIITMNKRIQLASIPIEIHTLYDSLVHTQDYETDEAPAFSVLITEEDILDEQRKSYREALYEGLPYPGYSPAELENTAVYRKIAMELPKYDALVFHGSAVAVGDKAFLFTAKSGTGKTTHTDLWLKNIEGSFVVNGDKPILRLMDGKAYVCGTPWMGKEGFGCNKTVPLSAVCFVNRSADNRIEQTDFAALFPRLLGQSYRPPDPELMRKTTALLMKFGQCVDFYELFCNMDAEAALVAYRGMCR